MGKTTPPPIFKSRLKMGHPSGQPCGGHVGPAALPGRAAAGVADSDWPAGGARLGAGARSAGAGARRAAHSGWSGQRWSSLVSGGVVLVQIY